MTYLEAIKAMNDVIHDTLCNAYNYLPATRMDELNRMNAITEQADDLLAVAEELERMQA